MKKICISLIILLLIFSTQVFALEDWGAKNKKIDDAVNKALSEYMEPYKSEDVPENERIINYFYSGGSFDYSKEESDGIFKASIEYDVEPYSAENTIWRLMDNFLFVEFNIVDGEYIVNKVSTTPENYDKFLERFEEYKKNGAQNVETIAVQGEKNEDLKSNQIETMSNIIFTISSVVFVIVILSVIIGVIKNKIK